MGGISFTVKDTLGSLLVLDIRSGHANADSLDVPG